VCGIVGVFAPEPIERAFDLIRALLDPVRHRGPDGEGIIVHGLDGLIHAGDDARGRPAHAGIGHRRLAIFDPSPAGHQPMSDSSGSVWISFNGAIYNFLELRREIEARQGGSIAWRSRTDTEVLVELIARDGLGALQRLEGMFAFIAIDTRSRKVLFARDRFGIKPLYSWIAPNGSIVLASEIKQFAAHPGFHARLDGQRAWDYLGRGILDASERTLFRDVLAVPAGHAGTIDLDALASGQRENHRPGRESIVLEEWYRPIPGPALPVGADASAELRRRLERSVGLQLAADVRVGSCLSGGLDSTSIVSTAALLIARGGRSPLDFHTFTARHPDPALDEWRWVEETARASSVTAHEVHPSGAEMWKSFERWIRTHDEPPGSASAWAQYAVFAAAANEGVRVMLDGQGADESLGGYPVFFKVALLELLRAGELRASAAWWRSLRRDHGHGRAAILLKLLAAWMPRSIAAPIAGHAAPWARSMMFDRDVLGARARDPLLEFEGRRSGVRDYSIDLIRSAQLPMLLHWEDRNSMAHSIEARVPFLDTSIVEFALALPAAAKLDPTATKKVLREAMRGVIPESVRTRRDKIAFRAPEEEWLGPRYETSSAPVFRAAREAIAPLLSQRGARNFDRALAGAAPRDNAFFRAIAFGTWLRVFDVDTQP
jgi:asparagine synthase (glutamine-hydrolysing)